MELGGVAMVEAVTEDFEATGLLCRQELGRRPEEAPSTLGTTRA